MQDERAAGAPPDEADLLEAPERGSATELMDHGASGELGPMRHSAAARPGRGGARPVPGDEARHRPVIEDGFYYDFLLPRPSDARRPAAIEERMRGVDRGRPPVRVSRGDARTRPCAAARAGTSRSRSRSSTTSLARRSGTGRRCRRRPFYRQGPFIDLCRGPHVASTGKIGPFKLLGTAGAYWRGDEKRPMLQRVYGTAWSTQEDLDAYLWRREEAKKRDHRRLGVALDLFSFHDVSPGAAFWHPKGQLIWRTLEGAMRELQARRGYQEVSTPIVVSSGCGGSPATGTCIATTCSSSSPRTRRSASSR
jgi:threonyl-tRNA synthetase